MSEPKLLSQKERELLMRIPRKESIPEWAWDWILVLDNTVVAAELRAEKLAGYAVHKGSCAGFPAISEEYVRNRCSCGLQELLEVKA